jgi:3-oxoacyl-[acyl-carrier protein] reductase
MKVKQQIIVAGALGALGNQIAKSLSEDFEVIGLGRSKVSESPSEFRYFSVDLLDRDQLDELREQIVSDALYGVINCVGSVANTPIWKMNREQWDRTLADNLTSCFSLISAFSPILRSNGTGRIILMSSVVARNGSFGASHYAAAKGGIESLTKSVALELAPRNITVNAVAPGYMDSGIIREVSEEILSGVIDSIPQRRLGPSHEVSALVKFLLSEDASYITGETIGINGGL